MELDAYQVNQLEMAGNPFDSTSSFASVGDKIVDGSGYQAVGFKLFNSGQTTNAQGGLVIAFNANVDHPAFTFDPTKKYTVTITEVS